MTSSTGTKPASGGAKDWAPVLEQATQEVFELMLNSKLIRTGSAQVNSPHLTAMVGLAGQLCGLLSIRCDKKAAALMASKMLGLTEEAAGNEVFDAFGEVGNMVAGNFKNKIAGLGDSCMLSVPTVVTGFRL